MILLNHELPGVKAKFQVLVNPSEISRIEANSLDPDKCVLHVKGSKNEYYLLHPMHEVKAAMILAGHAVVSLESMERSEAIG
jgi:hypothetical protein